MRARGVEMTRPWQTLQGAEAAGRAGSPAPGMVCAVAALPGEGH